LQELYSKKKEFLVLDVATSNVDMVTDQYIQNCLKTKFKDTTIITIAHRLETIADYDRVIVMDKGTIV
jgi:ATP-binding cassette subfamily C (CFTR/MRP) protein 4